MRVLERLLSLLLAVAVLAAGVLVVLEVAWAAAGQDPLVVPWRTAYTSGTTDAWDSPAARTTAAVLLAVGLVLLVVAVAPRRARRLPLVTADADVDSAITRRGLRTTLSSAARQVDGVGEVTVRVSRRRVRVRASSRLRGDGTATALGDQVETVVRGRLEDLQLTRAPRLRTRVTARPATRSS